MATDLHRQIYHGDALSCKSGAPPCKAGRQLYHQTAEASTHVVVVQVMRPCGGAPAVPRGWPQHGAITWLLHHTPV